MKLYYVVGSPQLNAYFDRVRQDRAWAMTAPPSPDAIGRKPKGA